MTRRVLAIVVAAVLALGGAILVIAYARGADQRAIADQQPTSVWLASKQVPSGTSLKDARDQGLIAQTQVAAKGVPAGALTNVDASNEAQVALSDVAPGEFLLAARFGAKALGSKAIDVPDGKLAVSVQLSDPARVGAFVTPGSHITIFQTYKIRSIADDPKSKVLNDLGITGTSILLPDVLVIAMGNAALNAPTPATATAGAPAANQTPSFLVTVAVSPEDATLLVHGINNRVLYAGLRGQNVTIDPNLQVTDLNQTPVKLP